MGRITEAFIERDGALVLFRPVAEGPCMLDILTDDGRLAAARALLSAPPERGSADVVLGTFGPFEVTLFVDAPAGPEGGSSRTAALILDGPEPSPYFHGNQAAGMYVTVASLLAAIEHPKPWPTE